ncbi:MAG TPA: pyridoxamine 5'-phosphate oxidase family protein, partial [Rhodopila sp.]
LLLDPRAALLFVDWTDGTLLHLRGKVDILWDQDGGFAGAERLWRISITDGWRRRGALSLRWSFQTYAPQTLGTGIWSSKPIYDNPTEGSLWLVPEATSVGF